MRGEAVKSRGALCHRAGLSWWEAWGQLWWEAFFTTPIAYTTNYSLIMTTIQILLNQNALLILVGGRDGSRGMWLGGEGYGKIWLTRPGLTNSTIFFYQVVTFSFTKSWHFFLSTRAIFWATRAIFFLPTQGILTNLGHFWPIQGICLPTQVFF